MYKVFWFFLDKIFIKEKLLIPVERGGGHTYLLQPDILYLNLFTYIYTEYKKNGFRMESPGGFNNDSPYIPI